tara:strand:- start:1800 stop:3263 length:1464 start_codon:yes stop_codon:yes gene_type:complete
MSTTWRERLKTLRDNIFGPQSADDSSFSAPAPQSDELAEEITKQPLHINLGIDFGTSFTKVCYRDLGTEETGVVVFEDFSEDDGLIPTIISIDDEGYLYIGEECPDKTNCISIKYIKMMLADMPINDDLPVINGVNLNNRKCVYALASWFLSSVIKLSQEWVSQNETNRLINREPVWSANVGVPVEHYDSDALQTFQKVLGIAWLWVKNDNAPAAVTELVTCYENAAKKLKSENIDFHAVPEIAAAVQSFIISREAVPGVYVYFDVGGGTLDGVAFKFLNEDGERQINFYSGKVSSLGIAKLSASLSSSPSPANLEDFDEIIKDSTQNRQNELAQQIREMVGNVVITAKRKDGRSWQEDAFQSKEYQKRFMPLTTAQMRPLPVFIGGGGARSNWYQKSIESTYAKFGHKNAGIPPYKLIEVPKPNDLDMGELPDEQFRRFAISYGLSIPYGEGPAVRLPSQFERVNPRKAIKPDGIVDYSDSKDVYD